MKRYLFTLPFFMLYCFAEAQLSGTYSVGPNAGNDYATLTEVITALKNQTITDDLTFILESGTYEEVLEFTELNNGACSITFSGEDAINTIIKPDNISDGGTAGITVNGVDNLTFENLTFDMENISSSTYSMNSNTTQGFYVEDATNLLFEELQFSNANSTGANPDYVSSSIYLYIVESVVVSNCSFSGAANHIRFREYTDISITDCDFTVSQRPINGSVNGSVAGDGLLVRSNTMNNVVQGLFMNAGKAINEGITNVVIDDNFIYCIENALDIRGINEYEITANEITTSEDSGIGIELSYTGTGVVENNIIDAFEGIYCFLNSDDGSSTTVANNLVKGVAYAIQLRSNNNSQLFHNTFHSTGEGELSYDNDGSYTIDDPSRAILLDGFLDTLYVVNNIISGEYLGDTLYNSGIEFYYPTFDSLYINYNLYDTALTSVVGEDIGSLEISDIPGEIVSLTEWQNDARAQDTHSQSPDYEGSLFESEDDLHITDEVDFRFGTYLEHYDTDIDGHIRLEPVGIDVGADQYAGQVFDSFSCLEIYDESEFGTNINGAEFCFENSCSESLEADTIFLDYQTNADDFSLTSLEFEISENDIDVTFDFYYQGSYLTGYNHLFEVVQNDVDADSTYSSNLLIMYEEDSNTSLDHCFSLNFDFTLAPGGSCGVAYTAAVGSNTTDYSKGDQWYTYTNTTSDLQYVQVTSYGYTTEETVLRLYEDCNSEDQGDSFDGGYDQSDLTRAVYPGETIYIQWENENDASYTFDWFLGYQDIETYGALACDTTVQVYAGTRNIPYLEKGSERLFYYTNETRSTELLTVSGGGMSRIRLIEDCDGAILTSTGIRENPVTGMFIESADTIFIRLTGEVDTDDPYELEIEIQASGFEGLICELATEVPGFGNYTANLRSGHGVAWFYYVNDSDSTQAVQANSCLSNDQYALSSIKTKLYHSCSEGSSGSSVSISSIPDFCDLGNDYLQSLRSINYVEPGDTLFIEWVDDTGSTIDEEFTWSLDLYDGYIGGLSCEEPVIIDEGTHLANDEFGEQWYLYINESADSLHTVKVSSCGTMADATNIKVYTSCGSDAIAQSDEDNVNCTENPYSSEIIQEVNPGDSLYMVWLNTGEYIVYDWTIEIQSKAFVCVNTGVSLSMDVEACNEYEFDGEVLTMSGSYDATFTSVNGCDSLVNLNLTILEATSSEETIEACESYEWEGQTYTSSGTYETLLTNAVGCDSTATLVLSILESTEGEAEVQTCKSYEWEGQTYTNSGTYETLLTNAVGCDSTATLVLSILESTEGEAEVQTCESYEWEGQTYTNSGTYEILLTNAAGCDSTATLVLSILESTEGEAEVQTCESYEWEGQSYTSSGTYETLLTNAVGCDSTATLVLSILESTEGEAEVQTCESYEWEGQTYTNSGTYEILLTNAAGCDSTASLSLNILADTEHSIEVNTCEAYSFGQTTLNASGFYSNTFQTESGCDSTVFLTLHYQETPVPDLHWDGLELTALDPTEDLSYQWVDCSTGERLIGENARKFTPFVTGTYSVEIANKSCFVTSDCYEVTGAETVLSTAEEFSQPKVYPNPGNGQIWMSWEKTHSGMVSIIGLDGKICLQKVVENQQELRLTIDEPGLYVLRFHDQISGAYSDFKIVVK